MEHPPTYPELRSRVLAYVEGEGRALSVEIERTGLCGPDVWADLRRRGFLRLAAPAAYGGHGLTLSQYLPLLEAFSQLHGSIRMVVHVVNGIWRPIDLLADDERRRRFVIPVVKGEVTAAFSLTEPVAGTGADIKTSARRDGDDYLITGEKWLITFADTADYLLLFGRLEGSTGAEGTLAFMVPRDAPGLRIEPMPRAMGLTGTGHAYIHLDNCRVPAANRLGEEGQGLTVALNGFLDPSRVCVGMTCVGLAQRALDLAVRRAHERVTFGQPLSKRQAIQMGLAEAATDLEAARQLCLHAGRLWDEKRLTSPIASMAKLFGSEMLQRVTDRALQTFGGGGYFQPSEIERIYRDARAQRFEEGTAEIQKTVIARHLLGGRAPAK
ncbi:MAG: acyl-CoA dehydrogenase family protein [Opitutaceae bacterium]